MNIDNKGNKVADKKISKTDRSRNIREKRMARITRNETPSKICDGCGLRIRSVNHVDGAHHRQHS